MHIATESLKNLTAGIQEQRETKENHSMGEEDSSFLVQQQKGEESLDMFTDDDNDEDYNDDNIDDTEAIPDGMEEGGIPSTSKRGPPSDVTELVDIFTEQFDWGT